MMSLIRTVRASTLALILANLTPLVGVLYLGWSTGPIMVFYWTENLVVGFYNVLKMRLAQGDYDPSRYLLNGKPVQPSDRRAMIVFFVIHYGFFTLGHGVFVLVIFGRGGHIFSREIWLALLFLMFSHGISYRHNFIGHEEYRHVSFPRLFWQPYQRLIVMHLTILIGGALAQAKGSPLPALILLVGLKTLIDLISHLAERRKFKNRRSTA